MLFWILYRGKFCKAVESLIQEVSSSVPMLPGGLDSITRAIADQARTIRIPVHMVETINKLIRIKTASGTWQGSDAGRNCE